MTALIAGIIVGFVVCIPIGPLNLWVINTYLKRSAFRALSVACGGSIMDSIYFYVILSGLSLVEMNEKVVFYFQLFGILFIFGWGVKELLTRKIVIEAVPKGEGPKGLMAGLATGMFVYTSNPTLILTMTGLGAFLKSLQMFPFHQGNIFLVSLGLGLGSFLWFAFLVKVVERFQESVKNKYLPHFSRVCGVLMVGLALLMGNKLYFSKGGL